MSSHLNVSSKAFLPPVDSSQSEFQSVNETLKQEISRLEATLKSFKSFVDVDFKRLSQENAELKKKMISIQGPNLEQAVNDLQNKIKRLSEKAATIEATIAKVERSMNDLDEKFESHNKKYH